MDLPHPLGPITDSVSPDPDLKVDAVDRPHQGAAPTPYTLARAVGSQHRRVPRPPVWICPSWPPRLLVVTAAPAPVVGAQLKPSNARLELQNNALQEQRRGPDPSGSRPAAPRSPHVTQLAQEFGVAGYQPAPPDPPAPG